MLLLLPPSEGKTVPAAGDPVDLPALACPELAARREELCARLARLTAGRPATALKALGHAVETPAWPRLSAVAGDFYGTLAAAITNGASDSFGGKLTDEQRTCLTDGVTGLDEHDRNTLLVGLVVSGSGALDMAGVAELGQVTNGLLDRCHLDIATTQTRPPDQTVPAN